MPVGPGKHDDLVKATPVAPEPPPDSRLAEVAPVMLYRNSWRAGWSEGYRAAVARFRTGKDAPPEGPRASVEAIEAARDDVSEAIYLLRTTTCDTPDTFAAITRSIDALIAAVRQADQQEIERAYERGKAGWEEARVEWIWHSGTFGAIQDEVDLLKRAEQAELAADLVQAEATLTALKQQQEWQPIETAPKDGTEIVALVSGCPYFVSWTTHGTQHAELWWRDREGYGLTEPTHWMPLPPLPPETPDIK